MQKATQDHSNKSRVSRKMNVHVQMQVGGRLLLFLCSVGCMQVVCASLCLMHNAPALLPLQRERANYNTMQLLLHYATRRAPVKNHNGVTLCALLYLLFASQRQRETREIASLHIKRAKPASINFYSYLICDASRDLILGCVCAFCMRRTKKCVHIARTVQKRESS